MTNEVKQNYEKASKKHKLPVFENLDAEFHLSDLEDSSFLLSEIRGKILDKLNVYVDLLSDLLHPDTTFANMYESRIFSDNEKGEVLKTFKRMMFWKRASLETALINNDVNNAKFISEFTQEWIVIKPKLSEVIERLKKSWEEDTDVVEKLGYFG